MLLCVELPLNDVNDRDAVESVDVDVVDDDVVVVVAVAVVVPCVVADAVALVVVVVVVGALGVIGRVSACGVNECGANAVCVVLE